MDGTVMFKRWDASLTTELAPARLREAEKAVPRQFSHVRTPAVQIARDSQSSRTPALIWSKHHFLLEVRQPQPSASRIFPYSDRCLIVNKRREHSNWLLPLGSRTKHFVSVKTCCVTPTPLFYTLPSTCSVRLIYYSYCSSLTSGGRYYGFSQAIMLLRHFRLIPFGVCKFIVAQLFVPALHARLLSAPTPNGS